MDFGVWLAEVLQHQGLAVFLVVGGGLFAVVKVWPFLTDRVYPDWQARMLLTVDVRREEAQARRELAHSLSVVALVLERLIACCPPATSDATGPDA